MFKQGDLIIYSNEGVCRVEEICPHKGLSGGEKLYYRLAPVYGSGFIFIPVDTKVFMRSVITKEDAENLIAKIPEIKSAAIDTNNQKMLSEYYRSSFTSHKCEDLLQLIKTVYVKTQKLIINGKKPGQTDRRYMKRAEELLHGELAAALEIPFDDVGEYIEKKLSELNIPEEVNCG